MSSPLTGNVATAAPLLKVYLSPLEVCVYIWALPPAYPVMGPEFRLPAPSGLRLKTSPSALDGSPAVKSKSATVQEPLKLERVGRGLATGAAISISLYP